MRLFLRKHKNDIILIAVCLALAFAAWGAVRLTRKVGAYIIISADTGSGQTEIARYPLDKDAVIPITTPSGTNTLTIKDGAAKMTESDCPRHLCENQGAIRYSGQMIVCLPHKLIVRVAGTDGADLTTGG